MSLQIQNIKKICIFTIVGALISVAYLSLFYLSYLPAHDHSVLTLKLIRLALSHAPASLLGLLGIVLTILLTRIVINISGSQKYFGNHIRNFKQSVVKKIINPDKEVALGIIMLFTIAFTSAAWGRHVNLDSNLYDFGLEHQVIWNTSEGRLFEASVEVDNYLGDHASFITLGVGIIYKLFPNAFSVLLIQTLAVAVTVFYLWKAARLKLKSKSLALIISTMFWVYVPIAGNLLFDYHPLTLAMPFVASGVYYFQYKKRYLLGCLLFVAAILCKEEIGLGIGAYGAYNMVAHWYLVSRNKTRVNHHYLWFNFLLAAGSTVFSILALTVFIPFFRGEPSDTLVRYAHLGNNITDMCKNLLISPSIFVDAIVSGRNFRYIVRLLLPLLFIPVLSPRFIVAATPYLLLNLLPQTDAQTTNVFHYDAVISVFLFFGFIEGAATLKSRYPKSYKSLRKLVSIVTLFTIVVLSLLHPIWRVYLPDINRKEERKALLDFQNTLDESTVLVVSNKVGGQFGEFRNLYFSEEDVWQNRGQTPKYIILDELDHTYLEQHTLFENIFGERLESIPPIHQNLEVFEVLD